MDVGGHPSDFTATASPRATIRAQTFSVRARAVRKMGCERWRVSNTRWAASSHPPPRWSEKREPCELPRLVGRLLAQMRRGVQPQIPLRMPSKPALRAT